MTWGANMTCCADGCSTNRSNGTEEDGETVEQEKRSTGDQREHIASSHQCPTRSESRSQYGCSV